MKNFIIRGSLNFYLPNVDFHFNRQRNFGELYNSRTILLLRNKLRKNESVLTNILTEFLDEFTLNDLPFYLIIFTTHSDKVYPFLGHSAWYCQTLYSQKAVRSRIPV